MRVVLDYREAVSAIRAGKGEYTRQLTRRIIEIAPKDFHFTLLLSKGQTVDIAEDNVSMVVIPTEGALWHIMVVFWLTFIGKPDIYWATTSVIIPSIAKWIPSIITLYDFTPWRFPKTHYAHASRIEKTFMAGAIKNAKALLAISEFTKTEAEGLFPQSRGKITVTHLGVDTQTMRPVSPTPPQLARLKSKYGLPAKYVLYLGTIEPRKNIKWLIDSFEKIKEDFPNLKLVLAGGVGWHSENIFDDASSDVLPIGYIDDEDKAPIYSQSEVFVFPSIYEGFGIPPLEAMACGVPTIISDRASLPEVGGNIAKQVSLEKPDSLQDAMKQYLKMSPTQRLSWQKQSTLWARQFTWDQTAQITIDVISENG